MKFDMPETLFIFEKDWHFELSRQENRILSDVRLIVERPRPTGHDEGKCFGIGNARDSEGIKGGGTYVVSPWRISLV